MTGVFFCFGLVSRGLGYFDLIFFFSRCFTLSLFVLSRLEWNRLVQFSVLTRAALRAADAAVIEHPYWIILTLPKTGPPVAPRVQVIAHCTQHTRLLDTVQSIVQLTSGRNTLVGWLVGTLSPVNHNRLHQG